MPVALPNLYCTPNDVYELMSIDAAQLRLDDQNQASGQQVVASAAAVGATSIGVAALQYPLLRGARLVFQEAGMSSPVEVTLTGAASIGATSIAVSALETAINAGAIAIDNGANVWLAGLMSKACKIATSKVQDYCLTRYDDSQLINSWTVNQWAATIAAHWIATRVLRAAPQQIQVGYEQTIEDLKSVHRGEMPIANTGPRTSEWPFLSNVTVDLGYTYRKVRVETPISEPTTTQYPQSIDWNSVYSFEW